MKFLPGKNTENYTGRLVSMDGRWEMGFIPRIYGWAVGFSPIGSGGPTVQYCAGEDWPKAVDLLITVQRILEKYPNQVTEKQLCKDFPVQTVKPVWQDAAVWDKLHELAGEALLHPG